MPAHSLAPESNSYLLRLHSQGDNPREWRASLQDIRSGEWRHFASLSQLFVYLTNQLPIPPTPTTTQTAVDETPPAANSAST